MALVDIDRHVLSEIINTQRDIKFLMAKQDELFKDLILAVKEAETEKDSREEVKVG